MNAELSINTRASLLEAIKNVDDQEGWREFARLYSTLIRRLALSASLSEDEAEEVLQEVLISVARNIGTFKYDSSVSSFKRWLSNITHWRITSQKRKRWRQNLSLIQDLNGSATGLLEQIPSSESQQESSLDKNWTKQILEKALDQVKKRGNAKHYQIYFLHVLKERPVADVCRQLKVSRGQVYLAKFRVGKLVERELRSLAKREAQSSAASTAG